MTVLHRQRLLRYAWAAVIMIAFGNGCSKDMQDQPSFEPQEAPRKHSPTGSVPRESRSILLSEPDKTDEALRQGASLFAINCAHCHGVQGNGDGPVAGYLKEMPANLHALDVQKKPETDMYEIVTRGKDAMPPFRGELSAQERWAVVYFIKSLSLEPPR